MEHDLRPAQPRSPDSNHDPNQDCKHDCNQDCNHDCNHEFTTVGCVAVVVAIVVAFVLAIRGSIVVKYPGRTVYSLIPLFLIPAVGVSGEVRNLFNSFKLIPASASFFRNSQRSKIHELKRPL